MDEFLPLPNILKTSTYKGVVSKDNSGVNNSNSSNLDLTPIHNSTPKYFSAF